MTEKTRRTITYIRQVLMAFAAMLALAGISHYGITGIDYLLPCVFALCLIIYVKAEKQILNRGLVGSKRDIIICSVLGTIASVAAVIGSHIDMETRVFSSMGLSDIVYVIFLMPFFAAVFCLIFFSSDACTWLSNVTGVGSNKKSNLKLFLISMAVMVVCWLPYYLTYFPGGVGNDDFECARMCLGEIPWTNHHPVFHVFIMNIFIKISGGNLNLAFGLMAFVQMLMLGATLSAIIIWLKRRNIRTAYLYASIVFFALHPIVAMYSIYITKDVLFACIIIMLVLFLLDICNMETECITVKHWVILGVISMLAVISRNNGSFVIGILAIYMLVVMKGFRRQLLVVFAVVFILNGIYKGPVWNGLGIEKQSFVESASIPLTQVAYTIYTDGVIEGPDREYLEKLMPFEKVKEEYLPGYTDSYKFSEYFDSELIDKSPAEFMKVWIRLLPKNFDKYVQSYLMQTSGYWKYGVSNTVATEGVQENDLGITGTDVFASVLGVSFKPLLAELVLIARKLPLLCMLSQMAIEAIVVLLVIVNMIRNDRKQYICAMVPLVALWISVMIASPAHCLFRYMCPVFFLWPVMTVLFLPNIMKNDIMNRL